MILFTTLPLVIKIHAEVIFVIIFILQYHIGKYLLRYFFAMPCFNKIYILNSTKFIVGLKVYKKASTNSFCHFPQCLLF